MLNLKFKITINAWLSQRFRLGKFSSSIGAGHKPVSKLQLLSVI